MITGHFCSHAFIILLPTAFCANVHVSNNALELLSACAIIFICASARGDTNDNVVAIFACIMLALMWSYPTLSQLRIVSQPSPAELHTFSHVCSLYIVHFTIYNGKTLILFLQYSNELGSFLVRCLNIFQWLGQLFWHFAGLYFNYLSSFFGILLIQYSDDLGSFLTWWLRQFSDMSLIYKTTWAVLLIYSDDLSKFS